jgi:acyl carrier protein
MEHEEVETRIKKVFIEKLGIDEKLYQPSAKIAEDLGADSLDTVELIMGIQDEFSIEVRDDEAQKLFTIGDAVEYVKARVTTGG